MSNELGRQPSVVAVTIKPGTKSSCPAEVEAPNMPITSPRCVTNQRMATAAPSTPEMIPVPMPLTPPQSRVSCQGVEAKALAAMPVERVISATTASLRGPKRSISQPPRGAVSPSTSIPTETAKAITLVLHWVSCCRGTRKTPGAERTPDEISRAAAVAATTIQP